MHLPDTIYQDINLSLLLLTIAVLLFKILKKTQNTENQLSLTKRTVVIADTSGSLKKINWQIMEHYRYYCISITWSEEEWNYHKLSHWKWDYWSYTFWKIYIRIIGAKEKIWVKYKTFQEAINVTVFSPLRQFKIWKSVITIFIKR